MHFFEVHHPISWLNHNQGAAIVLLTLALVLITAYYAAMSRTMTQLTQRSVEETQNQYLNSQIPTIWFRLPNDQKAPLHRRAFTLQPWNLGPGPAMDLEVKILKPTEMRDLYEIDTPDHFFGIALAPGSGVNIRFHLPLSSETSPTLTSFTTFTVVAEYRDIYGRRRTSTVDLSPLTEPNIALGITEFSNPTFPVPR
jgi:hypothetical protein